MKRKDREHRLKERGYKYRKQKEERFTNSLERLRRGGREGNQRDALVSERPSFVVDLE